MKGKRYETEKLMHGCVARLVVPLFFESDCAPRISRNESIYCARNWKEGSHMGDEW
jgi:hypothetical protein